METNNIKTVSSPWFLAKSIWRLTSPTPIVSRCKLKCLKKMCIVR